MHMQTPGVWSWPQGDPILVWGGKLDSQPYQCSTGDFKSPLWWSYYGRYGEKSKYQLKTLGKQFFFFNKVRGINLVWVSKVWGQDGSSFQVCPASALRTIKSSSKQEKWRGSIVIRLPFCCAALRSKQAGAKPARWMPTERSWDRQEGNPAPDDRVRWEGHKRTEPRPHRGAAGVGSFFLLQLKSTPSSIFSQQKPCRGPAEMSRGMKRRTQDGESDLRWNHRGDWRLVSLPRLPAVPRKLSSFKKKMAVVWWGTGYSHSLKASSVIIYSLK